MSDQESHTSSSETSDSETSGSDTSSSDTSGSYYSSYESPSPGNGQHILKIDLNTNPPLQGKRTAKRTITGLQGAKSQQETLAIAASTVSSGEDGERIRIVTRKESSDAEEPEEKMHGHWKHIQTDSISFDDFTTLAENFTLRYHENLHLVILKLFQKIQDDFEERSAYGSFVHPGTVLRCDGTDHNNPDRPDLSATFVCMPYFDIGSGKPPEPPEDPDLHLPRGLFQYSYPQEIALGRDCEQMFPKFKGAQPDQYLRVPQLWILILDSSSIVSCGPSSLADLLGQKFDFVDEKSIRSKSALLVRVTDFVRKVTYLSVEQCRTFIDLQRSIEKESLFEMNVSRDEYELHHGDNNEVLTAAQWPSLLRNEQSAFIDVRISRVIDEPERTVQKVADAPASTLLIDYGSLSSSEDENDASDAMALTIIRRHKHPDVTVNSIEETTKRLNENGYVVNDVKSLEHQSTKLVGKERPKIFKRPDILTKVIAETPDVRVAPTETINPNTSTQKLRSEDQNGQGLMTLVLPQNRNDSNAEALVPSAPPLDTQSLVVRSRLDVNPTKDPLEVMDSSNESKDHTATNTFTAEQPTTSINALQLPEPRDSISSVQSIQDAYTKASKTSSLVQPDPEVQIPQSMLDELLLRSSGPILDGPRNRDHKSESSSDASEGDSLPSRIGSPASHISGKEEDDHAGSDKERDDYSVHDNGEDDHLHPSSEGISQSHDGRRSSQESGHEIAENAERDDKSLNSQDTDAISFREGSAPAQSHANDENENNSHNPESGQPEHKSGLITEPEQSQDDRHPSHISILAEDSERRRLERAATMQPTVETVDDEGDQKLKEPASDPKKPVVQTAEGKTHLSEDNRHAFDSLLELHSTDDSPVLMRPPIGENRERDDQDAQRNEDDSQSMEELRTVIREGIATASERTQGEKQQEQDRAQEVERERAEQKYRERARDEERKRIIVEHEYRLEKAAREAREYRDRIIKEYEREKHIQAERERKQWESFVAKQKALHEEAEMRERELEIKMRDRLTLLGFEKDQVDAIIRFERSPKQPPDMPPNVHVPTASRKEGFRMHKSHIAQETLQYYDVPYSVDGTDPDYLLILKDMTQQEIDVLLNHTRRVRAKPPTGLMIEDYKGKLQVVEDSSSHSPSRGARVVVAEPSVQVVEEDTNGQVVEDYIEDHGRPRYESFRYVETERVPRNSRAATVSRSAVYSTARRKKNNSRDSSHRPHESHNTARRKNDNSRDSSPTPYEVKFNIDIKVSPFLTWPTVRDDESRVAKSGASEDALAHVTLAAIDERILKSNKDPVVPPVSSHHPFLSAYSGGNAFIAFPEKPLRDLDIEHEKLRENHSLGLTQTLPSRSQVTTSVTNDVNIPVRNVIPAQIAQLYIDQNSFFDSAKLLIDQFVYKHYPHSILQRCWGTFHTINGIIESVRKENTEHIHREPRNHSTAIYIIKKCLVAGEEYIEEGTLNPFDVPFESCLLCSRWNRYPNIEDAFEHLYHHHAQKRGSPVTNEVKTKLGHWLVTVAGSEMEDRNEAMIAHIRLLLRRTKKLLAKAVDIRNSVANEDDERAHEYLLLTSLVKAAVKVFQFIYTCGHTIRFLHDKTRNSTMEKYKKSLELRDNNTLAEYYGIAADKLISKAKNQLLLIVHTGTVDTSSVMMHTAITPDTITLLIATTLMSRAVHNEKQVDLVYEDHLSSIRYSAGRKPSKRLLRELFLLEEEYDLCFAVVKQQFETLGALRKVLESNSFRITNHVRIDLWKSLEGPTLYRFLQQDLPARREHEKKAHDRIAKTAEVLRYNIEIAEEGHSKAILVFTIVTIVFLPLSFVSSLFGMNTKDIRNLDQTQALFWIVAIPVTACIGGVALLVAYKGTAIGERVKKFRDHTRHSMKSRAKVPRSIKRRPRDEENTEETKKVQPFARHTERRSRNTRLQFVLPPKR